MWIDWLFIFLPFLKRRPLQPLGAYIFGAGADETIVLVLVHDVGSPAGNTADGKHGGEHVWLQAEHVEEWGGVVVHIGVEFALLEVGVLTSDLLEFGGNIKPFTMLGLAGQSLDFGSGVAHGGRALYKRGDQCP